MSVDIGRGQKAGLLHGMVGGRRDDHLVGVVLCPLVADLGEVAATVVLVAAGVVAVAVGVGADRHLGHWQLRALRSGSGIFPATGAEQLVQRVVLVLAERGDALVRVVTHRLRGILDGEDVAHWVVAVAQVLQ
ncbi:hypothetical protein D3C81_1722600 [compost metagenome]